MPIPSAIPAPPTEALNASLHRKRESQNNRRGGGLFGRCGLACRAGYRDSVGAIEPTEAALHTHVIGVAVALAGHHHPSTAAQVGSGAR